MQAFQKEMLGINRVTVKTRNPLSSNPTALPHPPLAMAAAVPLSLLTPSRPPHPGLSSAAQGSAPSPVLPSPSEPVQAPPEA